VPIRPLTSDDARDTAVRLLTEGFPALNALSWRTYLDRIVRFGGNAAADVPPGYLMFDGDTAVGVMLSPTSLREGPSGEPARVINLSSWYIMPPHRWRAALMLQSVLRRHEAMYTDLTPTPEVRAMLPTFGFVPINDGLVVSALPVAAVVPGNGSKTRDLTDDDLASLPSDLRRRLAHHRDFGCIAAAIVSDGETLPFLVRRRQLKGLPAAKVIYCPDIGTFQAAMPSVARFLISNGISLLISDSIGQSLSPWQLRRQRGLKFAKPGAGLAPQPGQIDHTGSELVLMDF
jgi:hypothetical protein